jgi:hypothetical protein
MATREKPSEEQIAALKSNFEDKYNLVLSELDSLSRGTFDEAEAPGMAAACLLAQAALLTELAAADLRSRALKRDVDFAKGNAYVRLRNKAGPDGKKIAETGLAQLINIDEDVKRITIEQTEAERDAKHLANIHALLKEAHITFRSIKKGV